MPTERGSSGAKAAPGRLGWLWDRKGPRFGPAALRIASPRAYRAVTRRVQPSQRLVDACAPRSSRSGRPGARVLDVCTGSGVVALGAALGGAAEVTAVDVSRRAVLTVRLNAALNGVGVGALRGSLFAPVAGRRFDLISSNPPYLPTAGPDLPTSGPSGRGRRAPTAVPCSTRSWTRRPTTCVRGLDTGGALVGLRCGAHPAANGVRRAGSAGRGAPHRADGPPAGGARGDARGAGPAGSRPALGGRGDRAGALSPPGCDGPTPSRSANPSALRTANPSQSLLK
jgi:SAM-dependent methyltransferase